MGHVNVPRLLVLRTATGQRQTWCAASLSFLRKWQFQSHHLFFFFYLYLLRPWTQQGRFNFFSRLSPLSNYKYIQKALDSESSSCTRWIKYCDLEIVYLLLGSIKAFFCKLWPLFWCVKQLKCRSQKYEWNSLLLHTDFFFRYSLLKSGREGWKMIPSAGGTKGNLLFSRKVQWWLQAAPAELSWHKNREAIWLIHLELHKSYRGHKPPKQVSMGVWDITLS